MINAPITNTAVSGMPLAQAGVAAGVASTSRQVGASLGVAIGGTIAARGGGASFVHSMRPFFWISAGAGVVVVILGTLSNSAYGRASLQRAAALIEAGDAPVGDAR